MKSILNPLTNEVLGFDDNMSDDQISDAIESDKAGRPHTDVNPTFYETTVMPAMKEANLTGNNQILYDARRAERAQDPFNKSINHAISFGLAPGLSEEEKKNFPVEDLAGSLFGQTGAILATGGVAEIAGATKAVQGLAMALRGATPLAIRSLAIGSGKVLAKTAGETISKTAAGVASASMVGGLYNGILETVNQGKQFAAEPNVADIAPDLVKVGQSILHGAVTWAPYGVGGAFVPKTLTGMSAGTAAVTSIAYGVSKAEGQSETDARLNAIIMGIFHFTMHTPAMDSATRKSVVTDMQENIGDYVRAKNGLTEAGNVHKMVGDEFVKQEAQSMIDQAFIKLEQRQAELLKEREAQDQHDAQIQQQQSAESKQIAKEERAAKVAEEEKLAGTFNDPYDPKMLDYLSQFIPARYIVRMEGSERLRLANSPRKELVKYQAIHQETELATAKENARVANKLENDILLRRTQNNGIAEVLESDTLTKELVKNVSKKIIDGGGESSQGKSKTGTEQAGTTQSVEDATGLSANGETAKKPNIGQPASEAKSVVSLSEPSSSQSIPLENSSVNFKPESTPLPGTGEVKESGLAKSVEVSAIQKGLTNDLGDLPSYKTRDMAEVAKKVEAFIAKDAELAKKIALGDAPEQDGVRSQELFTGLKIKAEMEGDVDMLRDLALSDKASSMATELGQRVKALDSAGEESPVEAIREIKKARQEAVTGKSKNKNIESEKKKTVKEIKEEIKKTAPTKETWESFIESLQC